MKTDLGAWRLFARQTLSGDPQEVQITVDAVIKKVFNRDLAWILTHLDEPISAPDLDSLNGYFNRLLNDEPLPYLFGEAEFFALPFFVSPQVLIPRPETEILVETVIEWLVSNGANQPKTMMDIGTGSGCIPISVLKNVPNLTAYAVDRSMGAIKIAHKNKHYHRLTNFHLYQGDLLGSVKTKFDVISGNLPYIPSKTVDGLRVAKYEPRIALDGGEDGMDLYRRLFPQLPLLLKRPGFAIFEFQYDQAEALLDIASAFSWDKVKIIQDYAGHNRFIYLEV